MSSGGELYIMINQQYEYYNNCISWNPDDVHCDGGLLDLIDNRIDYGG
jgi:hypothetical protein